MSPCRGFQAGRAPGECSALAPAAPIPRSGGPKAGFSSQSGPKAGFSSSQPCPRAGFSSQPHKELLDGISKLKNTAGGWRRAGSAPPRGKTGRKQAGNWSQSDLQPLRTPGSMDLGSRMRGVIGFWWRIRGWWGEEGSEHQDPGLGSWEEHGAKTSYLGCAMGPHRAARSVSDGWARWERGYRGLGGHH